MLYNRLSKESRHNIGIIDMQLTIKEMLIEKYGEKWYRSVSEYCSIERYIEIGYEVFCSSGDMGILERVEEYVRIRGKYEGKP